MKKTVYVLCTCIIAVLLSVCCMTAYAAVPVQPEKESSLTLQYRHNGKFFGGLEIKTYRIAEVAEDGTYALSGAFAEYPVDISEVQSQAEWKDIASTLAAYAAADSIPPTCTAITDDRGTAVFANILPGMYLTLSVRAESESGITVFETFLTALPHPDGDSYNYDVTAYPKCSLYTPSPVDREYKVVKQWKESIVNGDRPASITADIIRDGEVYTTQTLSAENNWSYSWTAPDDGAIWQAVEREVPKDYTVTVVRDGDTFLITNIYGYGSDKAPQTGKIAVFWHYAVAMAFSGGTILVLTALRRRSDA